MKTLLIASLLMTSTLTGFAQKSKLGRTVTLTRYRGAQKLSFKVRGDIKLIVKRDGSAELQFSSLKDNHGHSNGFYNMVVLRSDKVTIKQED